MARSSRSGRSALTIRRETITQSYRWPDWQLNLFLIVMLGAGGTLVGIFASFLVVQKQLQLGVPWIMPFGIAVGALTIVFILIKLILIQQRRLLPGFLMIGSFILLVLYITGLVETAIQLFGPAGDINGKCQTYVMNMPTSGFSVNTLAWLEQNSICQSWSAAFAFWIVGAVFLTYMIVLAASVANGADREY